MGSFGTWIVAIVLTAVIVWVIWGIRQNKKKGKSSCGGSCGCCPNGAQCHPTPNQTKS